MRNDSIDDSGPPYDPQTLEEFIQRGTEEFDDWWEALDPPGLCDGVVLDCHTARIVWRAVYEHESAPLALIYDSAETHVTSGTVAEIELGYVVDRYHNGSISFPTDDLVAWMAEYENRVHMDVADDAINIRIGPGSGDSQSCASDQEQAEAAHVRRIPVKSSPEKQRALSEQRFRQWWNDLDPPATYDWVYLEYDGARVVWHAAFDHLIDTVETVYESAQAHADVAQTTARFELGYIVHRYHNGTLSILLDDVINWTAEHEEHIHRQRDAETVTIRIEPE